jgi:hypothetical protein
MAAREKDTGGDGKEKESVARKDGAGKGRARRKKTVVAGEGAVPVAEAMGVDPKP